MNAIPRTAFTIMSLSAATFPNTCRAQVTAKGLEISHLTEDFYIYTTHNNYNGQPFPSNSMYVVTIEGVVLMDTPCDPAQFQPLLDSRRHVIIRE